jgi:hypothetical protein
MSDERNIIIEEKYVRTEVIEEKGQWVVYLEIGDTESSVKHRINSYHKKRLAEIAASLIKRAAEREEPFKNFKLD